MAFILNADIGEVETQEDIRRMNMKWEEYHKYLALLQGKLPPLAFEFATAPWHYDQQAARSLHDSWVNSLTITEAIQEDTKQSRSLEIVLKLLGPYHNGITTLLYYDVSSYSLESPIGSSKKISNKKGHGDLLVDEIRIAEDGKVLHEIEFDAGSRWIIICRDIKCDWAPIS